MNQITFATHRAPRLLALGMLYAAQGVPEGLLYVAVPAWLADRGVSAEAIGSYIAIILLPWSLKLINGFLMDRISYLPMGRRRPWLLAAQGVLVVSLLVFGLRAPVDQDLGYIALVGFVVNMAAAFQDVAIDGMTIEVVPENERAQANGVMWGGKTLGIAGSSFANGYVISHQGYGAAAILTATFVAVVMLLPLLMRERPNEKLLPWTAGTASAESMTHQLHKTWPIVVRLLRAVLTPRSLVFAGGIAFALFGYGLHTAFEPVFAVTGVGLSQTEFGNLAAIANLVGGLFGIVLSGWIANWWGYRKTLLAGLALTALLQLGLAFIPGLLQSPAAFATYTIIHALLFVLTSVCLYSEAMAASSANVAATQFSVYMAVLNLGTSVGAQMFGPLRTSLGYPAVLAAAAAFTCIACVLFWAARQLGSRQAARTG